MEKLSDNMKDALSGAYEVDGVHYHDGNTATGKALYARKLVGYDGNLTEAGHAIRNELLMSEGAATVQANIWQRYRADFDALTDKEIEAESAAEQQKLDEAESWLEAVAAWEAAGKPRTVQP